jgi:hypothetical protein
LEVAACDDVIRFPFGRLRQRGYGEQAILELKNFLDWMMNLPEDLEREFQTDLKAFEEAREMKYVTTIERMGIEQGREEEKRRSLSIY